MIYLLIILRTLNLLEARVIIIIIVGNGLDILRSNHTYAFDEGINFLLHPYSHKK